MDPLFDLDVAGPDDPEEPPRRRPPSAPFAAAALVLAGLAMAGLARSRPAVERLPPPAPEPTPAPTAAARPLLLREPMDLNRASAADLELLPRIGPALAGRILEERARRGRFARVDDLVDVRGIGSRTLARLRPLLTVESAVDAGPN